MNILTAIFLIGGVLAALIVGGIFVLIKTIQSFKRYSSIPPEIANLYSDIGSIKKALDVFESDRKEVTESLFNAQKTLDHIKTDYEARIRFDEASRESIKRLENIIAGTKTKGMAGENVLREIFSSLPPDMIVSGFKVRGKEVEYGMLLSNKKVVPIDSKWVATDLLASIANEEDTAKKEVLAQGIEKEVTKRINEVAQYIDPTVTWSQAIAAIPDAAYNICKNAHIAAYKRGVILIPYSMVVPYLLILFNFHLQFSATLDMDNLQHYIVDITRVLDKMDDTLENKIIRAKVMIENAASDYRLFLSSIKGSLKQIGSSQKSKVAIQQDSNTPQN